MIHKNSKIICTSDTSTHIIVAICQPQKVDEMLRRCMKSLMDFVDLKATDHHVNVVVTPTEEKVVEGVDLSILPKAK